MSNLEIKGFELSNLLKKKKPQHFVVALQKK